MDVLLFESLRTGVLVLPRTAPRNKQNRTRRAMTAINFGNRLSDRCQ
jgi:hypothetical protein